MAEFMYRIYVGQVRQIGVITNNDDDDDNDDDNDDNDNTKT